MGPLDEPIQTSYAIDDSAVLECANIAGLTHVPLRLKNITTYGLGEVMKRPLDKGCTKFIIILGESFSFSTNKTNDPFLSVIKRISYLSSIHY